jgi:hypothetical protein
MSQSTTAAATDEVMLRARIRISIDPDQIEPLELEDALADAIRHTVHQRGGTVEQLQLSVALDPTWSEEGPTDRWTSTATPRRGGEQGLFGIGDDNIIAT